MNQSKLHGQPALSLIPTVFLVAALGVACNSPTAPDQQDPVIAQASLRLSGAQVMVGGEVMNGQTVQPGAMHGGSTFFQAMLTGPNGPALGHTVQVQYQWPGGMGQGMMGNGPGPLYLYDDGTHGDPIAGDGIYCFDDDEGRYGFHMAGAPHGQYHYEFFGFDHDDHHSNHVMVTVTVGSG